MTRPSRFEGTIGRTLADSEAWYDEPPHPGDDAPDVVVILLDDVGVRPLRLLRLRHRHPEHRPLAAEGAPLHQLPHHPAVLADAGVPAHRAQPPRGRHAVDRQLRAPASPAPARPHHEPRRHPGRGAAATRATPPSRVGKWHLAPDGRDARRPVRSTSGRCGRGLRPLLRLPRRRDRPVPPRARVRQPPDRSAAHARRTGTTSPRTWSTRRIGCSSDQRRRPTRPAVLPLPARSARRHAPHQAPAEYLEKYRGPLRRGLGRRARERWFARQLEIGIVPAGTELAPRNPGVDGVGRPARRRSGDLACRLQEAFAAFLDHTDDQIGRLVDCLARPRPARQHARDGPAPTTGRARRAGRTGVMHEMKFFNGILETPDEAVERHRRHRRPTTATPTTRGAGRRPATRRSSGTSRTPTKAASTCRSSCTWPNALRRSAVRSAT